MNNTFKAFRNYGCLAAEKRVIYTADNPHYTAVTNDEVLITVPNDWEVFENTYGDTLLRSPWGDTYRANDLLDQKNDRPYISGYKDGKKFVVSVDFKEV